MLLDTVPACYHLSSSMLHLLGQQRRHILIRFPSLHAVAQFSTPVSNSIFRFLLSYARDLISIKFDADLYQRNHLSLRTGHG